MPKPYGRIEQGYINHPKFLALTGNAIALWHEGKNYCDVYLTEGLIPTLALKKFRFYGKRAMALLCASCGEKASGEPYAPLFEIHVKGYTLHHYLDHNDTRLVIEARMVSAEKYQQGNRERQAKWRAEQVEWKRRTDAVTSHVTPSVTRDITRDQNVTVTLEHNTTQHNKAAKEQQLGRGGGSKRPIFTGQRLTVFEWFLDKASQILGSHLDDFDIHEWFYAVDFLAVAGGQVIPQRDNGAWLEAQLVAEARKRGLPIAVVASNALGKSNTRLAAAIANIKAEAP